MDKQTFLTYTSRLEELHRTHEKKNEALKVLYPFADVWYDVDEEVALILDLLGEFFPDARWGFEQAYKNDIEWFWYEGYNGISEKYVTAEVDGAVYHISTFEELYDFLTKEN